MNRKEIEVCNNCHGTGSIERRTCVDPRKGFYENTIVKCSKCDGEGRLIKLTSISYLKLSEVNDLKLDYHDAIDYREIKNDD